MLRCRTLLPALCALGALAVAALPARAGTTGKLSGRALDENGTPLAGVTIRVIPAHLGDISDSKGTYFVIGIPAGAYTVRADMVGRTPFVEGNVEIRPDFTTTIDVRLKTEAIRQEVVRVEAERPLLQKDATGTTRFVSGEDMKQLPLRGFRAAVAEQSGVQAYQRSLLFDAARYGSQSGPALVVRGGRVNETGYYVDGFSQQDVFSGASNTAISDDAVQEVVVLTGGFAPEYGRVMSGAVNVVTKEGGGKYFGSVEAVTDNLAGKWIGAPRTDYNIYSASLGGPVIRRSDKLTFFVSGERGWERDRTPTAVSAVYRDQLESGRSYVSSDTNEDGTPKTAFIGLEMNPDDKPGNSSSRYTYEGKLAWLPNDHVSLRVAGHGSRDDWREYVHALLFAPEHMPRHLDETRSASATFTHVLTRRTFYTVGANYYSSASRSGDGVLFDDLTGYANLYTTAPRSAIDTDVPVFVLPGGGPVLGANTLSTFTRHDASSRSLQASLTSQATRHHLLKVGGDAQRHAIRWISVFNAVDLGGTQPNLRNIDGYGYWFDFAYDDTGRVSSVRLAQTDAGMDGAKHPTTASLYAQDKYEREGLIVNGGLRLDYLDTATPSIRDEANPLGRRDDPTNNPDSLEAQDLGPARVYWRVSPRLGVAFPVDEKTLLRFNYGQFYQAPNLQDLYVSYRFLQYIWRVKPYFTPLGSPDLRPERTTAYEAGVARQFGDNVRLDATMYYKDVRDLVEITGYGYRNRDFATIKGIDLGFTVRPVRHTGVNAAYSLESADGTGSASTTQLLIAWLGNGTGYPKEVRPLDFDQRHKLSGSVSWGLGPHEGPSVGRVRPLEKTNATLLFNAGSGNPYTPVLTTNEITLAATASRPAGPVNSRDTPWTSGLDVKVSRGFRLHGLDMEAYVWALNVLDTKNAINVYRSSGSAETTNWLSTADGQAYLAAAAARGLDGEALYRLAEQNPVFYSNPRLVRFGLRATF